MQISPNQPQVDLLKQVPALDHSIENIDSVAPESTDAATTFRHVYRTSNSEQAIPNIENPENDSHSLEPEKNAINQVRRGQETNNPAIYDSDNSDESIIRSDEPKLQCQETPKFNSPIQRGDQTIDRSDRLEFFATEPTQNSPLPSEIEPHLTEYNEDVSEHLVMGFDNPNHEVDSPTGHTLVSTNAWLKQPADVEVKSTHAEIFEHPMIPENQSLLFDDHLNKREQTDAKIIALTDLSQKTSYISPSFQRSVNENTVANSSSTSEILDAKVSTGVKTEASAGPLPMHFKQPVDGKLTAPFQPANAQRSFNQLAEQPQVLSSGDNQFQKNTPHEMAPSQSIQEHNVASATTFRDISLHPQHRAINPNLPELSDAIIKLQTRGGQVDVSLTPEDLGRLNIKLEQTVNGPQVTLSAERHDTQELMRRHIEMLQIHMKSLGFENLSFAFAKDHQNPTSENPPFHQTDEPVEHAKDNAPDTITLRLNTSSAGLDIRI